MWRSCGPLVSLQSFQLSTSCPLDKSFSVWSSLWCNICMSTSCTTRDVTIQGTVIKNTRLNHMALGDQTSIWVMRSGGPGRLDTCQASSCKVEEERSQQREALLTSRPVSFHHTTTLSNLPDNFLITPPGPLILDLYKIWSRQKVASLGLSPLDKYLKPCETSSCDVAANYVTYTVIQQTLQACLVLLSDTQPALLLKHQQTSLNGGKTSIGHWNRQIAISKKCNSPTI